jgi:hypothetical protein
MNQNTNQYVYLKVLFYETTKIVCRYAPSPSCPERLLKIPEPVMPASLLEGLERISNSLKQIERLLKFAKVFGHIKIHRPVQISTSRWIHFNSEVNRQGVYFFCWALIASVKAWTSKRKALISLATASRLVVLEDGAD